MPFIQRVAENLISTALNNKKALIILGARQVGKTTLIKRLTIGLKSVFFNLDVETDKVKFLGLGVISPEAAYKAMGEPEIIIVDEAQRLFEVGRIVKGWYDRNIAAKVILLGSSSLNLLSQTAESLTGRNEKVFLPPLTFREVLQNEPWFLEAINLDKQYSVFAPQIHSSLLGVLNFGSYPEAVLAVDKENYLRNLVADYLLKDILQIGLVKTPELIKRLLLLLAHQSGNEVSVSEISTSLGMSRSTTERYLDLLESTYVIFRLKAWSTNPRKEVTKSQKIFFWDTGIRNALLGTFSFSEHRPDIGILYENWVIAEFAKWNWLTGNAHELYFWRTRSGSEVDLVVRSGERLVAYEVKWQTQKLRTRAFESAHGIKVNLIDQTTPIFTNPFLV